MSQPARVHPNIRDANEPAHGAMKRAARYEIFQPCGVSACVQVEVQGLFPHGWKKTQMPLLPRVFLCDLQLDRLVRFLKPAEERRNWFARLEVDWAIFNLDDDVVRKFAVERMKNVVGSFGTIILGIAPIKMVVIDKRPVENDPDGGKQTSVITNALQVRANATILEKDRSPGISALNPAV